ncbi:LacI family DNA-binding transcriptional regulator [Aquipuribacter hungaricus]|uniref:LacI family DNA-binding transcriptional regulator n=1 Tax=Aquipuribacter hungaricus TaxID=545624 RepID=A0ABV7WEX6_9MICO
MAAPRVTITDVARHAGVSKTLVSFALNDRPGVSPESRRRILAAAAELGWRPSHRARSLSVSRAFALGLVVARPAELLGADPFFLAFIAGVETVLSEHDQALVLLVVRDRAAEVAGYERLARDGRVDGVLVTDLRHDDERLALLERLRLPAVTLNRPAGPSSSPAVCLDDSAGVREAVAHLVDLGHRHIGHVAGPAPFLHSRSRREAWAQALAEHGLPPGPEAVGDFSPASGAAATRTLLGADEPPTAVVYANDLMAMAGLTVAHQCGVQVPGDLSVTGFDDAASAAHTHPPLTTIRADVPAWGARCARTLLELVEGGAAEDVEMPPARLVVRDTTGPPRRGGP